MSLSKFTFLSLLMMSTLYGICQSGSLDPKLTWSEEIDVSADVYETKILGSLNESIYILKVKKGAYYTFELILEQYDEGMNLKRSSDLILKEGKKRKLFEEAIIFDNELYIFSALATKGVKREKYYYSQSVDLESLKLNDDVKKIATVKYQAVSGDIPSWLSASLSEDKSKLNVCYTIPSKKLDDNNESCIVYDKKLTKLYKERINDAEVVRVDNNGDLYNLKRKYVGKSRTRKDEPNYTYQLMSYTNQGEDSETTPMTIDGKSLLDMSYSIGKEGNLHFTGVYSGTNTFNVDGAFYMKYDPETKEILKQSTNKFEEGFIAQDVKDEQVKVANRKNKDRLGVQNYDYEVGKEFFFEDGSILFPIEQYYEQVSTTINHEKNSSDSRTINHNHHMIVSKVSAEGEITWSKIIPKKQRTYTANFACASYQCVEKNNKLYFIYNSSAKNTPESNMENLVAYSPGADSKTVFTAVDLDGNMNSGDLYESEKSKYLTFTALSDTLNDDEVLLYITHKNFSKQRFAKVEF